MKAGLITLLSIALAGCGGGGSGSGEPLNVLVAPPPVATPAPSGAGGCAIGYWGDSIGALTAPRLNPGFTVTPHNVVGGTAQAALAAFLQDPMAERFIVIEYGTNDANSGSDLEAPVTQMLAWARARGATPVLTGIPHEASGAVAVEADYSFWESTLNTLYSDWPAVAYNGPSDLMADGVHPADAYQQRLADALSETIENLAPECKQ